MEELERREKKYTCDTVLGNGTYGTVYKGFDAQHKPVAIKKVALYGADIETGVSCELLREFSLLQTLRKTQSVSSILFPIDMFIDDGFVILIYPLLDETLLYYMTRTTSQSRRDNIALFETIINELIGALHFCAHYNIRHNDVHASNVLVSISSDPSVAPQIKMTDLGLCTFEPALPWLAWSNFYHWSYFQAPELAKCILQEPIHKSFLVDSRVDVWSLGVIILEYGAPQFIKDDVKQRIFPRYKYDKSAHPTDSNDKKTVRLSMQGSMEYYHSVMNEWKVWMMETEWKQKSKQWFYTRLFTLLKNIFTDYKMRWNIQTCYEYWIERKCKLVIHDYSLHDRQWLSKFAFVLRRFQTDPIQLKFQIPTKEVPVWSDLLQYWYDQSKKNIIYVLECVRLLYDYLLLLVGKGNNETITNVATVGSCRVYHNKQLCAVIADHDWDELNQAIFSLVYKLLHNMPRSDLKINVSAERAFLNAIEFNIWSSWIRAPITSNSSMTFNPKHKHKDLQTIQSIIM